MGEAHTGLSFSQTSLLLKLPPQFWLRRFTRGHKKSKHFCLLFFV
nr:MAG TPA: hypothetical protein [Caudoviricetes sp.]